MPAKPIGFNRFALIAIREAHGHTRDRVATTAQCDPGHYTKLEKGDRGPSLDTARRLAAALGCDLRALVPGADVADAEVAA